LHRSANALALGSSVRTLALLCWPACLFGYGAVGRHYAQHQREYAYAEKHADREHKLVELRTQLRTQKGLQQEMLRTQKALSAAKGTWQQLREST
jgi:hypothetical protein